ncbi:MAG TPA: type II secretion system F family protein [Acholeplasmataceae bacterium]|mgnify:CR=1 FL=1|nr:type II secretion system F family protein [Acholeplasmataceae bacterium]HRX44601.1 type II secretion system F family protein [Acholeplasmataceae bacterium]
MDLRNYKYIAKNADGKTVRGTIEALNRNVVVKYLQSKNYVIENITEYHNLLTRLDKITFGRLLSPKQLIFFLKQLGSLLNAGIKLISALELLSLQQDNRNQRKLYFELYQQINNGLTFSKALSKRPKDFPSLLVQMVEVGELSGELGPTVVHMAEYYENQLKVQTEIKGALRMPLIYLTAAIVISIGMLLFVFPNITGLFASFEGAELPGITQMFLNVGEFLKQYAILIFGLIFLVVITIILLNKYVEKFHYFLTVLSLNIPIFGNLIQMNNQIMIANSLSQMLASGVNSAKALQTVKNLLSNVVYKDLMIKTLKYIEDGKPFSRAFEESNYIDPIMARMISTGEKTGNIPKLMENLSHYYNGITELRVQQLKNSIQPILLIVVYAIVGVLILAIMLPMLSLGSQI